MGICPPLWEGHYYSFLNSDLELSDCSIDYCGLICIRSLISSGLIPMISVQFSDTALSKMSTGTEASLKARMFGCTDNMDGSNQPINSEQLWTVYLQKG